MIAANYSEFRQNLKKYLDDVEDNHETLIIKRKSGSGTVMISLEEYNSLMETLYLLSSKANAEHLFKSIEQEKNRQVISFEDIDDIEKHLLNEEKKLKDSSGDYVKLIRRNDNE